MDFSTNFSHHCPLKINCGKHALAGLPMELNSRRAERPLILASHAHVGARRLKAVVNAFRSSGLTIAIYDQLPESLTPEQLSMLLALYRDGNCDSLIAVGCDSVVDAAKCLNLMAATHALDEPTDRACDGIHGTSLRPLFWVATPGGDGNEPTHYANDGCGLLNADRLMPGLAVIDPVMMTGSQGAVVNGALIGLVHAVEAFLDASAGPLVRAHAHAGVSLMMHYLPMAVGTAGRADGRTSLSGVVCAQILAGCSFSASSPGICHRLAGHTTAYAGLPTGYLMALFLPHMLAAAGGRHPDQVGQLLYPMAGPEDVALTAEGLRAPRTRALLLEFYHAMNKLLTDVIPDTLTDAGMTDEQLTQVRANLTREADGEALVRLFRQAGGGG